MFLGLSLSLTLSISPLMPSTCQKASTLSPWPNKYVVVPFERNSNQTCKNRIVRNLMYQNEKREKKKRQHCDSLNHWRYSILNRQSWSRDHNRSQSVLSQQLGYQVDEHNEMHFFWIVQQQQHSSVWSLTHTHKYKRSHRHVASQPQSVLNSSDAFVLHLLFFCFSLFFIQLSSYSYHNRLKYTSFFDLHLFSRRLSFFLLFFAFFWCYWSFFFSSLGNFPRKCSMRFLACTK